MTRDYKAEARAFGITATKREYYEPFRFGPYDTERIFEMKTALKKDGWPPQVINRVCLASSIEQIRQTSDEDLLRIPGLGYGHLLEIRKRLGW